MKNKTQFLRRYTGLLVRKFCNVIRVDEGSRTPRLLSTAQVLLRSPSWYAQPRPLMQSGFRQFQQCSIALTISVKPIIVVAQTGA